MNQKHLAETLGGVVEDCVNKVGVDLNTASPSLLEYISGISKALAKNIVAYREENGAFANRKQLLKVAKLGPKAFEQCAGFLRIKGGDNALDYTGVHPESYPAAEKLLEKTGMSAEEILKGPSSFSIKDYGAMAEELGIGEPTLRDIVKELSSPGRDPRDETPKPILRTDVMNLEDLKPGMILKGTVRNVIDFGAFVDIGVHQDGLVHISEMTEKFIKHPLEAVSVGDIVDVKVLAVDLAKQRISLSMKLEEPAAKNGDGGKKDGAAAEGGRDNGQKSGNRNRQNDRKNGGQKNGGQKNGNDSRENGRRNGNPGQGSQPKTGNGKNDGSKNGGKKTGNSQRDNRKNGEVWIPNSGIFAGKKF